MKTLYPFPWSLAILCCVPASLIGTGAMAQLNMAAANIAYTVNFDGTVAGVGNAAWAGAGFQPTPAAGQLDSDAWAVTGWSNGNLAYGGTQVTAGTDYRRGVVTTPIAVGGMYAFDDGAGGVLNGRALGFQPGAGDWAPGTITLRVQNNSGSTLTAFDIAYNVFVRNDQAFSSSFNLSVSDNGTTFTTVPSQDLVSPAAATGTAWVANARNVTVSGYSVPNGQYFYVRWRGADAGGTGTARDEFALDDISITGRAYTIVRFTASGSSVNESVGSTTLTASIVNPHPVNPTTVDVALSSGPAARINNYTTQTLTFPGGSTANQTVTITVTDNGTCDGDASLVFTLQNLTGGISPAVASPSTHTMALDDDETASRVFAQFFDGGVGDNWTINAGAGNQSTATGAGDTPASQRILTGTQSWQVNNTTATLDLATVSVLDWSGITLSARVSATSLSTTGGADAADSIAFYVSINGGSYPLDPDVRIAGNSNARWGYSTGTGVASTTAGTPINHGPAAGGNRTTDGYSTVNITIPDGTNTVSLRVVGRNNAVDEFWNLDNVQITGTLCSPVYYSRSSGSQVTATWSTARTGAPAPSAVTFNENATMVVQNTHVVTTTNNALLKLRNLNVETGGTLDLAGTCSLEIHGPTLDADGSLLSSNDDLSLLSTELTSISGSSGTINLRNITLNGLGAIVTVNTLRLTGTLQLNNGDFNANGKEVQLLSDVNGTARLGPVAPTASYTDRLRIERYIPAGVTDWRLLCSPVSGKTVSDWTDDFLTAGFPGSYYPNFFVNNVLWPSVRKYEETNPGALSTDGLVGVSSVSEPLTVGRGFAAWSGTTLNTTTAFTVDVRGFPTVASTPFSIPVTYTNTGNPTVDGLNLVGNPLPSPIDFSDLVLTNMDNNYYIYDPGSGTNAAWDEVSQVGTGGANGNIQSSQGFWMKAKLASPSVTVTEAAKELEPINGGIFSDQLDNRPMVRIFLTDASAAHTDEALVHFIAGSPAYGDPDMVKLAFSNDNASHVSTKATTGEDLVINACGPLGAAIDVPVKVRVAASGEHTLSFGQVDALKGVACVTLEDLLTGETVAVDGDATYTFNIDAAAPTEPARFVLHVGAAMGVVATGTSCAGLNDGALVATGPGGGTFNYTLTDAQGQSTQVTADGPATFNQLQAGTYTLTVDGATGCGALNNTVTITAPAALEAMVEATAASCAAASDGAAEVMIMGGTAPYVVTWDNGGTGVSLGGLAPGVRTATVTDANGCTYTAAPVTVAAGTGPQASFTASATEVLVGEEVQFFITGTYYVNYTWDMGDGYQTDEVEPGHVFDAPGVYTVTLTATDGDCADSYSLEVIVSTNTGLAGPGAQEGMQAWVERGHIAVRWQVPGADALQVELFDATGRCVMSRQATGASGRLLLPATALRSGAYLLRAFAGGEQRTFKLALER